MSDKCYHCKKSLIVFKHIMVTLVADRLRRLWFWVVYFGIRDYM